MENLTNRRFQRNVSRREVLRHVVTGSVAIQFASSADRLMADDAPLTIDGYCDRMSYLPGQQVGLSVSTNAPRYRISVNRVGLNDRVIFQKDDCHKMEEYQ